MKATDFYDRYADVVVAHPKKVLLLVALVVGFLGYSARNVRLDNNFAALFSTNSEAAAFRESYRRTFGADDGLLVAVLVADEPTDPKFIELVERISENAARRPDVRRVYSATETSILFKDGDTTVIEPAFGSASSLQGDFWSRVRLVTRSPLGGNRLLSDNGHVFLVVAELDASVDSYEKIIGPAEEYQRMVERAVRDSGLPVRARFAGLPYTRIGAIASMQGDLMLLTPLTSIALVIMLFAFFRRFVFVVIPLSSVMAAVVGTAGIIGLAGDDLNQITVIYPILLMVITVATAVHYVHRFEHERHEGKSVLDAARTTAARITEASMLQTLTTVFGFGSLVVSDLNILHGFGVYVGAGVALAFFFVATAIPAMLVLFGDRATSTKRVVVTEEKPPTRIAIAHEKLVRWLVQPKPAWTITIAMFVGLIALCFTAVNVIYDYRISDNLYPGHPIAQGNAILDEHSSGIIPIEVAFDGPPDAFLNPDILRRIDRAGHFLERDAHIRAPISLASVVRELNRSFTGRDEIPNDREAISQLLLFADGSPDRVVEQLSTPDFSRTRLRGSVPDHGARDVVELERRFQAFAEPIFAGTGVTVRMTGEAPVAYQGMNKLSEELLTSELWTLLLVVISIGLVFRSVKVAIASILPNALPILIGLNIYTLTGTVIDPLPGIVFCIGTGIAVDDTIHVISRYREELRAGFPRQEAMVRTMTSLWGALASTSTSIGAGFLVLCLSDFNMNRTMGALGALMIFLAWLFEVFCAAPALSLFHWDVGQGEPAVMPASEEAADTDVAVTEGAA